MIKLDITNIIRNAVQKYSPENSAINFTVDEPSPGVDADVSSNVAFALAKKEKNTPIEVAQNIAELLEQGGMVKRIEVSKKGFLNFVLDASYLHETIFRICLEKEQFGKKQKQDPPRVHIEFVSANPTGPLHIGHGRGAALGDSLARIYEKMGYKVYKEYYVNDVGVQMDNLAQSVKAKAGELGGKEKTEAPENGYKGEYIADIAKLMAEQKKDNFNQFPREHLLSGIKKDLEDFRVSFDGWFSESSLHTEKKVEAALAELKKKNVLKDKDGALWFAGKGDGEGKEGKEGKEGDDKDRVLRKSDGRYTYFASDIAYHQSKFTRGLETCIDIWGHDHHGYQPRVQSAMQALGYDKENLKILLYQLVSLKRGGKKVAMSTRAGEFVTLREILDEVGTDACRFFFAMRNLSSHLEFDVDLAKKQTNENPVFYVQYVHARICSIFREAEKKNVMGALSKGGPVKEEDARGAFRGNVSKHLLKENEERELMIKLGYYTDTIESCARLASPNLMTTYLMDLATRFHKFYDKHRVLDAPADLLESRLMLLRATQIVVKSGLSLLGVSAPEKM